MVSSIVYIATTLACVLCVRGDVRFVPKEKQNATLQVKTRQGIIQGKESITENGTKMFTYASIPFAEPPLDDLRFQEPKPNKKWKGVLDGTEEALGCIEMFFRLSGITTAGQEDCLYLNVYTPEILPSSGEGLPVMIFIYGGGFLEGNSSSVIYGADRFIEHGVILVKMNYRLGIFGFLTTGDLTSPGNYGLKDQLAAIKWTKENIKFFGGDPNRIVISGESAGSCSVMHHMLSKKSRGLFSGAIAMSGDTLTSWCNKKSPNNVADSLADRLGIDRRNTSELVKVLRRFSSKKLIDLQMRLTVINGIQIYHEGLPFTPTIEPQHDGAFITEPSYDLLLRGDVANVPLLIGHNDLELKVVGMTFPLFRFATLMFDMSFSYMTSNLNIPVQRNSQISRKIINKYFKSNSFTSGTELEILEYLSDVYFNIPIDRTIKMLYKHIPVYSYVFNYEAKMLRAAYQKYAGINPYKFSNEPHSGHAEEIPLFFKFENIPMKNRNDILVTNRLLTLWTNFAKYSHPTPKKDELLQNVIWPTIKSTRNTPYLYIGQDMEIKTNYRNTYMRFWEALLYKYGRQQHR